MTGAVFKRTRRLAAGVAGWLLIALVVLVAVSPSASALPCPGPSCGATPAGSANNPCPGPSCGATAPAPASPGPAVVDNLLPSDGLPAGSVPDGNYDIMYSTGGSDFVGVPNDPVAQAQGMMTNWVFTADRWTVHTALSLIHWSLDFHIADALAAPAATLAAAYQNDVVNQLGLVGFCLFLCAIWAGYQVFRGRLTRGAGEFAVSLLILAVTTASWAAPATFLLGPSGLLGQTRNLTSELAGVTAQASTGATGANPLAGAPPGCPGSTQYGPGHPGVGCATLSADEATAPLLESLHHAFVEVPYQLLNWGEQLDIPGQASPCLGTATQIVAKGPWGSSDTPRNTMTAAGGSCAGLATFNQHPSADRLIGAVLSFAGSVIVMVLAMVIAFSLLIAELTCVGLVAGFPIVAAVAIAPGGGRQLLWRWVTHALQALGTVIVTVMVLAVLLVGIDGILTALNGQALLVVFAVLDAMVIAGLLFRRRLAKGMRRAADNFGRRLEAARVGGAGSHRWLAPAAVGFGAAELLDERRKLATRMHQGRYAMMRAGQLRQRLGAAPSRSDAASGTGQGSDGDQPLSSAGATGPGLARSALRAGVTKAGAAALAGTGVGAVVVKGAEVAQRGRGAAEKVRQRREELIGRLEASRNRTVVQRLQDQQNTKRPAGPAGPRPPARSEAAGRGPTRPPTADEASTPRRPTPDMVSSSSPDGG